MGKSKAARLIFAAAAFSLILSLFGAMWVVSMFSRRTVVMGDIAPRATPTPTPEPLMGAIANVPRPTPTPREVKGEYVVGMRAAPTPTLVQIRKNAAQN
jgi:hypothetical protein